MPGSVSGARVQWLAGQKGSRPHGTDLVVGKTGSSLSGPGSGPAARRWCGQAHLNVRSEEPATGAQCADPRGCRLVHRGSPAGGRRLQGHTWSGGRGGAAAGRLAGPRRGPRQRSPGHRAESARFGAESWFNTRPVPRVGIFAEEWLMGFFCHRRHRLGGSHSVCRDRRSHVEADLCPRTLKAGRTAECLQVLMAAGALCGIRMTSLVS